MKKFKNLIIGTLGFVVLFYTNELNFGFNISIYALLLLVLLIRNSEAKKDGRFWWLALAAFISILAFAYYADAYSFLALFTAIGGLSIKIQFPTYSRLMYPVVAFISGITSPFRFLMFPNWIPKNLNRNHFGQKFLLYFIVPGLILSVFILVYSGGSDIFASFFENFFEQFSFWKIIVLGFIGLTISFNLWYSFSTKEVDQTNDEIREDFNDSEILIFSEKLENPKANYSRISGVISMSLVNIALLAFLISYNYEQFFQAQNVMNLSAETHQRVETVILSIVLAIGIILFYFRSVFNFDPKAKNLRNLTFVWMGLNFLLILSTLLKTLNYIEIFGLTYKRIGVLTFLGLSVTGLIYTFLKIKYKKTNSYLLVRMMKVGCMVFIMGSWINFSWLVTKYNTTFQQQADFYYLRGLKYNHLLMQKVYKNDPRWGDFRDTAKDRNQYQKKIPFLDRNFYEFVVLSDN